MIAEQGRNPLAQKAYYMNAVSMLAAQAAQSSYRRLRSPRLDFTHAQYPNLTILKAGADACALRYDPTNESRGTTPVTSSSYSAFKEALYATSPSNPLYRAPLHPKQPTKSSIIDPANDITVTPPLPSQLYNRSLTVSKP